MSSRASRFQNLERQFRRIAAQNAGVHGMNPMMLGNQDTANDSLPLASPDPATLGSPVAADATDPIVDSARAGNLPIWLFPPVNWENVDQASYTNLAAIGSTATILSFQVPIGRNGVINKVANNFVGGGWVEGTGDIIWRILVDGVPPPGATSYRNIVNSLGSPANPTAISGFRIFENQIVTVTAFNNPAGPNGGVIVAGQLVGARLCGYLYPREVEQVDIWV